MVGKITFSTNKIVTIDTDYEAVHYEYASFWERLLARFIDVIIITIPNFIIPFIPSWLYWSLQQSSNGQSTVGQKALGIKVISADGQKVTFGQATGRFFANYLNLFTFFIGYFLFFFSDRNQCLHDLLSGCLVVKEVGKSYRIDEIGN